MQAQGGPLEVHTVVGWMCQILEGLAALREHAEPVALGVLEPRTICITRTGALIVDLRMYQRTFPERAALLMARHQHYLAPEEISAVHAIIPSDLYGVGSIGYWLLTGQVPDVQSTMAGSHLPAELRRLRPDFNADLLSVLASLLSFHPHERPPTRVPSSNLSSRGVRPPSRSSTISRGFLRSPKRRRCRGCPRNI